MHPVIKSLFMRKVLFAFLPAIVSFYFSGAQNNNNRLLDQPMNLRSLLINIDADPFTATTFIEMEFYNSNSKEIEGLYQFELKPGQVITGFQLELNGKYRDGSIEEKWKARAAYNTIVGKRVDPALLQMDWQDHYRMNIYPIPPKGSRKIRMILQQLMKAGNNKLDYLLPFNRHDTTGFLKININVHHVSSLPVAEKGLVEGKMFVNSSGTYSMNWETEDVVLSKPISFSVPCTNQHFLYCTKSIEQKNHFALHYRSSLPAYSDIHPKKISVFWDASASGDKRETGKEINFLQQYVSYHDISQLTIIPFNHTIIDTAIFYTGKGFNSRWQQYLRSLPYDGATQLGILDFSHTNADAVFLFSDGKNTYGRSTPKTGNAPVFCINSSRSSLTDVLTKITGSGGGNVIDLNKNTISAAIGAASRSQNWLLNIVSAKGKTIYEQELPIRINGPVLINGVMEQPDDTLIFYLGTNGTVNKVEKFYIKNDGNCPASSIDKINMLTKFESMTRSYCWEDALEFGLKEKVVTAYTSYIVLERIEDYIKYNISPPGDLTEESKKLGYIKKDTRLIRQQGREKDEFDIINGVTSFYNEKIKQWDKNASGISFKSIDLEQTQINATGSDNGITATNQLQGNAAGVNFMAGGASLDEVVVVGDGTQRKQAITGSIASIYERQILPGTSNFGDVLKGRIAGLDVTTSGSPGSAPSIRVRGISSLSNSEPLIVLDGMPVSGNINDLISVNDIERIDILKDAAATSIYGSRGGNGVILITGKKGRPNYRYSYPRSPYRLKDMEDVEYMEEMKGASMSEKPGLYQQLKMTYRNDAGFYFDMAQHFFEVGLKNDAWTILMSATEATDGNYMVLKAMGYTLESWKYFDKAIEVYQQLADMNPMDIYACRDLAWAYYQNKNYQQAIDILYEAIKKNFETQEPQYQSFKAILLSEMNAIISVHKQELNISVIPPVLIKPMPVDLRIFMDGNVSGYYNVTIHEPGGTVCSREKPVSKKNGYLNKGIGNYYYYYNGPQEYQIKNAAEGKYRISVDHYDYSYYSGYYPGRIPSFVRISTFKNFGKKNQTISIQNVIMDNQSGTVEIGEVKWEKIF